MDKHYIRVKIFFLKYENGGKIQMPGDDYAPSVRAHGTSLRFPTRLYGLPKDARFETWYEVELELPYQADEADHTSLGELGMSLEFLEGSRVVAVGSALSSLYLQQSLYSEFKD